jgi:transcriptional regulator with XRE-family HTH domain
MAGAGRPEKPQWDEPTQAFKRAVGQTIRKTRQEKHMSVQELGVKVGLSQPMLSNIEQGKRELSLPYLYRIAEALEVPVTDLMPQKPATAAAEAAPDRKAVPVQTLKPG